MGGRQNDKDLEWEGCRGRGICHGRDGRRGISRGRDRGRGIWRGRDVVKERCGV